LNFNAIAQGYSADVVASYLHSIGVRDMLVDIGEIYCEGLNPNGKPWTIAIDRPVDGNVFPGQDIDGIWQGNGAGCGVVTSGNYRKFYEKAERNIPTHRPALRLP
jgi:thiamine biosynthesis lipoprotein